MKPRDSLSGQNNLRRQSGVRSSRALSNLFFRLKKLDKQITFLDEEIRRMDYWRDLWTDDKDKRYFKLKERRTKLDKKRKEIRNKRKGYET